MAGDSFDTIFDGAAARPRDDVVRACEGCWDALGRPGTWWNGPQRIAIAAETRTAASCELCARRHAALTPYAAEGAHDGNALLPAVVVDAVHRIATDPGRLGSRWYREVTEAGIGDAEHVEVVAVVATVIAVDSLCRGLGVVPPALPASEPGEPTREVPPGAEVHSAWVRTVVPDRAEGAVAAMYGVAAGDGFVPHVIRSLTLVPDDAVRHGVLALALYPAGGALMDATFHGALLRHQTELVAATVSVANACFY